MLATATYSYIATMLIITSQHFLHLQELEKLHVQVRDTAAIVQNFGEGKFCQIW